MRTKSTVTIGIPAYNEEKNIGNLLHDILAQKEMGFTIRRIIVVSDGSTDKTVTVTRSAKDTRIQVINNRKRSGLASSLNTIFENANTDVVVTLDADIRIQDREMIRRLVHPIREKRADYTSSSIAELESDSRFAKSITLSMQVKRVLYTTYRNSDNIYTSYGLARAYSKRIYTHLRFPTSIGNDMYAYLYCHKNGYRFTHVQDAMVYYRAPEEVEDYRKQSARFFQAKRVMEKYFGKKIRGEFRMPVITWIISLPKIIPLLAKSPQATVKYIGHLLSGFLTSLSNESSDMWDIASSTKGSRLEANKPTVHVLTKYFYPVAAGIETNILETYASLAREWDIHIHTTNDEYMVKSSLKKSENIRGMYVHRYDFESEMMGYVPQIDYGNASILALHNFNLYYWRIFVRVMIDRILGRKRYLLVVTPHGGYNPEWSMFPIMSRMIKRAYHQTLGVLFLNHVADKIRAVSVWEKAEMVKCGVEEEKIRVIPNGLEQEAFMDVDRLVSSKTKKLVRSLGDYIIQIGRIYPIKNYETVIRALPRVPNIKYVIVGGEEKSGIYRSYKDSLLELARELGVESRLIFAGVMRGADKYYVLKHAITMVHPAKYESYCNVVHEALSQGLVPIVANNTALPYLVREGVNGYLVGTEDSEGFATRIKFVLKNRSSRTHRRMSEQNRRNAESESWANVGINMRKYYEE